MFCCDFPSVFGCFLLNFLIFAAGTAVLVKGSDLFVDAAASLARLWHVPELVIGLTLVSIGTSLPELASSTYASICDQGEFTIGNIVGSNVTNIALILGVGILGAGSLPYQKKMVYRDGTVMLAVYSVTTLMFLLTVLKPGNIHGLNWIDGIILLVMCAGYMGCLFHQEEKPETECKEAPCACPCGKIAVQLLLLVLGVIMISAGSKAMVDPVIWAAVKMKIPMLVISSTIVAFGTSVPELAVTIAGVIKKQHDITYGNIIGSNIFNILLIFGVTSCINPLPLHADGVGLFNLVAMVAVALALLGMMIFNRKQSLGRIHGFLLLVMYAVFLFWNCRSAF